MGVGNEIKIYRAKNNLSQQEFGELFEPPVSKVTVSGWETGKYSPDGGNLLQLARVLSVSLESLVSAFADVTVMALAKSGGGGEKTDSQKTSVRVPIIKTPLSSWGSEMLSAPRENAGYFDAPLPESGRISQSPELAPFAVYAEGDSMTAAGIFNGSLCVINPAEKVRDGDSALLVYGDENSVVIRRIFDYDMSKVKMSTAIYPDRDSRSDRVFYFLLAKDGGGYVNMRILGKVMYSGIKPIRG